MCRSLSLPLAALIALTACGSIEGQPGPMLGKADAPAGVVLSVDRGTTAVGGLVTLTVSNDTAAPVFVDPRPGGVDWRLPPGDGEMKVWSLSEYFGLLWQIPAGERFDYPLRAERVGRQQLAVRLGLGCRAGGDFVCAEAFEIAGPTVTVGPRRAGPLDGPTCAMLAAQYRRWLDQAPCTSSTRLTEAREGSLDGPHRGVCVDRRRPDVVRELDRLEGIYLDGGCTRAI